MSVLERYSVHECSLLLSCPAGTVVVGVEEMLGSQALYQGAVLARPRMGLSKIRGQDPASDGSSVLSPFATTTRFAVGWTGLNPKIEQSLSGPGYRY